MWWHLPLKFRSSSRCWAALACFSESPRISRRTSSASSGASTKTEKNGDSAPSLSLLRYSPSDFGVMTSKGTLPRPSTSARCWRVIPYFSPRYSAEMISESRRSSNSASQRYSYVPGSSSARGGRVVTAFTCSNDASRARSLPVRIQNLLTVALGFFGTRFGW